MSGRLAELHPGALGGKLPARYCYVIALNEQHFRQWIRDYANLPRRPHSRFAGKGHAEQITPQASLQSGADRYAKAAGL
jgi:hypothetical protein